MALLRWRVYQELQFVPHTNLSPDIWTEPQIVPPHPILPLSTAEVKGNSQLVAICSGVSAHPALVGCICVSMVNPLCSSRGHTAGNASLSGRSKMIQVGLLRHLARRHTSGRGVR